MPKIYLASSFQNIPRVIAVSAELESHGNKITTKWWAQDNINIHSEKDDNLNPEKFYQHPACKKIFERDLNGIKECQIFILVAGDIPAKFNGANIELGIAFQLNKALFSIGKLENCALYHPVIKCENIKELNKKIYEWCIYPAIDDSDDQDYEPFDDYPDCIDDEAMY
jgi:nucleoside 2-deoxyribosyltransferase